MNGYELFNKCKSMYEFYFRGMHAELSYRGRYKEFSMVAWHMNHNTALKIFAVGSYQVLVSNCKITMFGIPIKYNDTLSDDKIILGYDVEDWSEEVSE